MNNHNKKIIAPAVIVTLIVLYNLIGAVVLTILDVPVIIKVAALIVSVVITIVLIAVLLERIKEIKKGEEDDLSEY
jgi:hypothetical protein